MLTRKQFDLLVRLEQAGRPMTQREMAKALGCALGTANSVIRSLQALGLAAEGEITPAGVDALKPYRVKHALILAAGFGSRLVPVTLTTPKPLVRIRGRRIIDSLLDALTAAGIEDICIVRGYLKEQFDQLLEKYPAIRFFDNPHYNETNNISSAMYVREWMPNAYIFDADFWVSNPALITKYQYQSNYLGTPVKHTDDWCLTTKNGYITGMQLGGTDCYLMYTASYWDARDGAQLARDIEAVYQAPGGKERYWDQAPLEYFAQNYKLVVRPCRPGDIIEIDTYRELKALDPSYT